MNQLSQDRAEQAEAIFVAESEAGFHGTPDLLTLEEYRERESERTDREDDRQEADFISSFAD